MTANGRQRPPRPQLEIVAPSAGPDEAAAIAAALEQFLHDAAPAALAEGETRNPWTRAAILEAVGLGEPDAWGDTQPWR
jgi:hypothetical protein